jgi:hypothetical protein
MYEDLLNNYKKVKKQLHFLLQSFTNHVIVSLERNDN